MPGPVRVSAEANPGGWLPSGTGSAPLITHSLFTVRLAGAANSLNTRQLTASVFGTSTVKPVSPTLVTVTSSPVTRSVQTAFAPSTWNRPSPAWGSSWTSMVPAVTPPAYVSGKLTALEASVVSLVLPSVTSSVWLSALKVQPAPPGVASSMVPPLGTICLTTESEPSQSPRASCRRACPTMV